ncbi:MAG: NADP-dependent oxidoreductase [Hamadaea sp.]|nr:NADP-dependent oxidoreductase [Hamadaea sp.]
MRAIVTEDFGAPPQLAELDRPEAGPGEVRVRVLASSLNGFDLAMAAGYLRAFMEHSFPAVLGRDFAGVVDQIGDGVTAYAPGDEVFGVILTQPLRHGGFAEHLVVPEGHTFTRVPAGLSPSRAGILGLAGSAAVTAVDRLALRSGEQVLISGATGGVGAVAMQLAVAAGVSVVATAAPGAESEHVRALGAAAVVDRTGDLTAQVRALAPEGVDAVLHLAGDPAVLADLVAPGGRLASLLIVDPEEFAGRPIAVHQVVADPRPDVLDRLAADVLGGALRMPVQHTYALDEVPKAFGDFAAGTLGKLAVRID